VPQIVWNKTGDSIKIDLCQPLLYEYLIDTLSKNSTVYTANIEEIDSTVAELNSLINKLSNSTKEKFGHSEFEEIFIDPFDQGTLNKAHNVLILTQSLYPNFADEHWEIRSNINQLIHNLEKTFNRLNLDALNGNYHFDNPFNITDISNFHVANLSFEYNHHGRSLINKWEYFDDNIFDVETNDFRTLNTKLVLSIKRPMTLSIPYEYQEWADKLGVIPIAPLIPLANIQKLNENLSVYREVIYKNLMLKNNFIVLTI
jgi:hypothetical protein